MAQLHERTLLECGTGNDLAPNAQLQHVFVEDDLQEDLIDSGHHHAHSQYSGGWAPVPPQARVVVRVRELPLTLRQPLSERVTWRESTQGVRKPHWAPDAAEQKIARGGP